MYICKPIYTHVLTMYIYTLYIVCIVYSTICTMYCIYLTHFVCKKYEYFTLECKEYVHYIYVYYPGGNL